MDKYILVYNPKYLTNTQGRYVNTAKVTDIFGAREGGVETGKLIEKPGVYSIEPAQVKKFRADVGRYLLRKYGFLVEVDPKDLDSVLNDLKDKAYKCELCDFETDTKIALAGHKSSHKLSEEAQKILAEIPVEGPSAYIIGAEKSASHQTQTISVESGLGIPQTNGHEVKDADNVTWYGAGLEQNRTKGGMNATPSQSAQL